MHKSPLVMNLFPLHLIKKKKRAHHQGLQSNGFIVLRSYMSCNAMLNRNKHAHGCKNRFL